MPALTVTWQSYDSITPEHEGYNLSSFGGFEEADTSWPDYLALYPAEWHLHLEAIRHSIIAKQIWAGGDWHQDSPHGVPVLSDGHFIICTWRGWGELLAAVWNSELGQQFTYLDFYIGGRRLPERPAAWA